MRTTPDCLPHLLDDKNIDLMEKHGVLSREEIESRYEIMIESYCKTTMIVAKTMISMATKRIAPAVERYTAELAGNIVTKRQAMPGLVCAFEKKTVVELSFLTDSIASDVAALEDLLPALTGADYLKDARMIRDKVIPAMEQLRADCDAAERLTAKDCWPLPSYGRLLFGEK